MNRKKIVVKNMFFINTPKHINTRLLMVSFFVVVFKHTGFAFISVKLKLKGQSY